MGSGSGRTDGPARRDARETSIAQRLLELYLPTGWLSSLRRVHVSSVGSRVYVTHGWHLPHTTTHGLPTDRDAQVGRGRLSGRVDSSRGEWPLSTVGAGAWRSRGVAGPRPGRGAAGAGAWRGRSAGEGAGPRPGRGGAGAGDPGRMSGRADLIVSPDTPMVLTGGLPSVAGGPTALICLPDVRPGAPWPGGIRLMSDQSGHLADIGVHRGS